MIIRILSAAFASALAVSQAGAHSLDVEGRAILEVVMKKKLGPDWSADQIAAGHRFAEGWQKYAAGTGASETQPISAGQAKVAAVLAEHEVELMAYPHVIAVADGFCRNDDQIEGTACIIVYVDIKLPLEELGEKERLPAEIDGVQVDVVETGQIGILPVE